MVYYPTDFPFYIEDVDKFLTIPYQQDTDTNTERTNQTDCNSPDRRTLENQQLPTNSATQNNQEDNTRNKRRKTRRVRRSNSFSRNNTLRDRSFFMSMGGLVGFGYLPLRNCMTTPLACNFFPHGPPQQKQFFLMTPPPSRPTRNKSYS